MKQAHPIVGSPVLTELLYKLKETFVQNSLTKTLSVPWTDNQQEIIDPAIKASSNGSVRIDQSATKDEVVAWATACPWVSAQSEGSITLSLAGKEPIVPIPIEILVGG